MALQIVIAHAHGQFQFAFDITGQIHEFGCFSKVDNWTTHVTCVMSLWKPSYSIDGNVVQIHSSQLHNQTSLSKLPRATSLTTNTFSWLWRREIDLIRSVVESRRGRRPGFIFSRKPRPPAIPEWRSTFYWSRFLVFAIHPLFSN